MKKALLFLSLTLLVFSTICGSIARAEMPGLPFEVSQEQNYWCWAALTQAFSAIKGIRAQQCEIVDQELGKSGRSSCCLSANESREGAGTCNPRFMSTNARRDQVLGFSAVSRNGVLLLNKKPSSIAISDCSAIEKRAAPDCKRLNLTNAQAKGGQISAQEVRTHVEAGRPVGLFYQFGNFATGHFIWIAGIFDYLGHNGTPRYLINDPQDLMFFNFVGNRRVLTYDQLVAGERISGFGVSVQARWIATGVGKGINDR